MYVYEKEQQRGREREEIGVCEGDRWRDMHNENRNWMVQDRDISVPLLSNSMEEYHKICP